MPQPTIVTQAPRRLIAGSISRRVVLAGGTGVVATADLAVRSALAQGTPTPGMPAVQAPVRQEWLDKRHEEIIEPDLPIIDRFPDDAFYRQGLRSKVQRVGTNASPMEESNQHGNRRSSLWTRSL